MNMHKQSILVVEDQTNERDALVRLLRTEGYNVLAASSVPEAKEQIGTPFDLLITDLRLGRQSGIELLEIWRQNHPSTPVIVVTAYGAVDTAVDAMKKGAIDYLMKPLKPDELLVAINRYLPMRQRMHDGSNAAPSLGKMIGNSPAMRKVFDAISRVASSESIVLITGESGTGKELVASAIHQLSTRSQQPFVAVNIAALPEALVEAELFGHVKGAFTGANESRQGRFQFAQLGTLFMDEIGDFPLVLQPKLLRVLEGFTFSSVGSNEEQKVDVRLITATSRNLQDLVNKNQFRADLFHRLNVLTVELPPLRERPEDIEPLVQFFIQDCAARHLRTAPAVARELMEFFCSYDWPGNVRQLRNAIENMMVMGSKETLSLDDLPRFLSSTSETERVRTLSSTTNLGELEKIAIIGALKSSLGNKTHAAQKLGISVRTLQRKLKAWECVGDLAAQD